MFVTRLAKIVVLAALAEAGALLGAGEGAAPVFELSTGGGPPGADIFVVALSAAGHLQVIHRALPMTANGMTESKFEADLEPAAADRLVELAFAADDFDQGCGKQIADGTNAHLDVRQPERTVRRDCLGASKWPVGPKTLQLFAAMNSGLPKEFQVF